MAAYIGRRLRKGAATTAVAALAVAALSASQAPGAVVDDQGRQTASDSQPTPDATADDSASATGNSPYYTDLPPLNSPNPSPSPSQSSTIGTPVSRGEAEAGIPATVLDAYKKAEAALGTAKPQLQPALAAPRGHRQGRVGPGPRWPGRRERHHDQPDPRPAARRQRLRAHPGHRQRRVRRQQQLRLGRRAHAVHPVHLGVGGPRRQRRRQGRPQQHLRRGPRRRPLPVPVRLGPVDAGRPEPRDPQLQQLDGLSEPRAVVAGVLPQGHPRGPGRHGHGCPSTAATTTPGRVPRRRRTRRHRAPARARRGRARRGRARRPRRSRGSPPRRARPPCPRPPTRCTTWRTRVPPSSPRWRATRSPRRSARARRPRPARPSARSGSASRSSATPTPPSPAARAWPRSSPTAWDVAVAPALKAGEKTGDLHGPRDRRRPYDRRASTTRPPSPPAPPTPWPAPAPPR